MAKVQLTTKNGTKITVEGTPEEVAILVSRFEGDDALPTKRRERTTHESKKARTKSKMGPQNLVSELIDGGYFKKPKGLGDIKITLEEQGHFYPVTTLSPVLLRIVKRRELRRIRDKSRWVYVS